MFPVGSTGQESQSDKILKQVLQKLTETQAQTTQAFLQKQAQDDKNKIEKQQMKLEAQRLAIEQSK